jgi:opacity protein-like surface antigen
MRILMLCALVLLPLASATGQSLESRWELSFSGTGGWASSSSTYGGETQTSDANGYLTLAIRPGYYVIQGFSIEPEILWTAIEGTEPAFSLAGNLSYTFDVPGSKIHPFILAGAGIGNSVPLFRTALFRSTDEMDVVLLNVGAGAKFFVSNDVAIRFEYRYQHYSYDETIYYYYYYSPQATTETSEEAVNYHHFFLGISLFL